MSVLLRCPTCGTTQRHAGECEACSEGDVRYFCTNHDDGIWLEGPVCSRCGARFGDPPQKPRTPRPPIKPARPAGAPDFRPPAEPEVLPAPTSIEDLLEEITGGRARTHRPYEVEEVRPPAPPPLGRVALPVAGCLVRAVGLAFLLIAAVIIFLLLLFGGFIGDL